MTDDPNDRFDRLLKAQMCAALTAGLTRRRLSPIGALRRPWLSPEKISDPDR